MKRVIAAWVAVGALAYGCGSNGSNAILVGIDDGGGPAFMPGSGSDAILPSLTVSASPAGAAVCLGTCVALSARASGGAAPYVYKWDGLGSDGGAVTVCPAATTTYAVAATDSSGHAGGEFSSGNAVGSTHVTVTVASCTEAGTPPADAGADSANASCDSVTDVSPSGANPYGPWSYGWSSALGAAFSLHKEYLVSPSGNGITFTGLAVWTSGISGIEVNPASYVNVSGKVVQLQGLTVDPGGFLLHPGPTGQYSIARWTARAAGTFGVQATFTGIAGSTKTTTDVHVQHNGNDVASGSGYLNLNGGGNTFLVAQHVSIVAGDTIDFAVGDGGNTYLSDSTGLSAKVCREGAGDGE